MTALRDTQPNRRDLLGLGAGALALGSCAAASSHRAAPLTDDRRGELDELFADLTDQRHRVEPISSAERAARRARLARLLAERALDALLVEPDSTLEYLAGVHWSRSERLFGLVVLADGSWFWICPSFEEPKARLQVDAADGPGGDLVTWDEHEYAFRPLAAALAERGAARVAVDPMGRAFVLDELRRARGDAPTVSGAAVVKELRGRKDAHELAILRHANELTQRAIAATAERLEPGMTGRAIGEMVTHAQARLGFENLWVLPLIGPAAAYPHGEHDTIPVATGDVVLVDTGGSFHGYESDITRTWVQGGKPSAEVAKVWNTVRDAQQRAFDAMMPGVRAGDVDRVARRVIEDAGYGRGYEHFSHRLGHGIGMEGHEEPYLDGGNDLALAPGMTFSDEPGIYLYGEFGVRLEDIVVVTEDGADHFGDWQRSPMAPAGPA